MICYYGQIDHGNAIAADRFKGKETPSPENICTLFNQDSTCLEPDDSKQSVGDRQFLDTLETDIYCTSTEHIQMALPLKSQNPTMPDNKEVAIRRLMRIKRNRNVISPTTQIL